MDLLLIGIVHASSRVSVFMPNCPGLFAFVDIASQAFLNMAEIGNIWCQTKPLMNRTCDIHLQSGSACRANQPSLYSKILPDRRQTFLPKSVHILDVFRAASNDLSHSVHHNQIVIQSCSSFGFFTSLADSKGQGQGHAHFDCEYLRNEDR